MKASLHTLFCFLFLGTLAACGSKSDDNSSSGEGFYKSENGVFSAKVEWPEELKAGSTDGKINFNNAIVTFLTPDEKVPGSVSFTKFDPRMPVHNHGTETKDQKITARTDTPNVFDVSGIYFIMAGEATTWVTDVFATVDGKDDKVTIPISRDVND